MKLSSSHTCIFSSSCNNLRPFGCPHCQGRLERHSLHFPRFHLCPWSVRHSRRCLPQCSLQHFDTRGPAHCRLASLRYREEGLYRLGLESLESTRGHLGYHLEIATRSQHEYAVDCRSACIYIHIAWEKIPSAELYIWARQARF